jgi:moderate conductance mechanosensitive channel
MSFLCRATILGLLVLQLVGQAALAQPVVVPSAPQQQPAQAQPDAAIGTLLAILKDPTAREELVRRLEATNVQPAATSAPAEPDVVAGAVSAVEDRANVVADVLLASAHALGGLPDAASWLRARASDPRSIAIVSEVLRRLAFVFAIGGGLAAVAHLFVRHYRPRLVARDGTGLALRVTLAVLRVGVELVPLLLFVTAVALAGALVDFSFMARLVANQIMIAITLARGLAALRRGLLHPLSGPGRLIPVGDEQARELTAWGRWIGNSAIYGYFVLRIGLILGLPWELFGLLEHLLFLAVTAMVVALILRLRGAVRDELLHLHQRVGKRGWTRLVPLRRLADHWHVIAIALVVIYFTVWALHLPNGFRSLLVSTAATLVVVLLARLCVMVLSDGKPKPVAAGPVEDAEELESPAEVTEPGLAWRRVLRFAIDTATLAALVVIWVPGLRDWLRGPEGVDLLTALLRIGVVVAFMVAVWLIGRRRLESYVAATDADGNPRHSRRARTIAVIANNALLVALLTFGGFFALAQLGVDTRPLLAGAGVIGIAVGFGAQKLVQDIITGLFILLGDTVRVGDVVDLGVKSGAVEAMSMRTITLRDYNGALHNVPYSAITVVTNMTKDYAYAVFDTSVAYEEDVDRVMDALRDVDRQLRREWPFRRIMLEPIQIDGLDQFGPSANVIKSRIKVRAGEQWRVSREFNRRVKKRFDELGIDMPFPRQIVRFGADSDGRTPRLSVELRRRELLGGADQGGTNAKATGAG